MAVTHNRTMRDYADYLKTSLEEVGELVKAFLINVTQFFRDPDAFAYLKNEILPSLITTARQRDHVLRFWTAGCATGEEPYSLSMLLTELLGAELSEWSVKIFATDLDEAPSLSPGAASIPKICSKTSPKSTETASLSARTMATASPRRCARW